MGNFGVRNTLAKTTLSCNLYGAAAADPGPNPAGQAPSLPTRGCGSGGTPSTGYDQTRLDRPVYSTNDDRAWFGHIPWTGWWVGRGGALLKITLAGGMCPTVEN
jgi:hypothetical protein